MSLNQILLQVFVAASLIAAGATGIVVGVRAALARWRTVNWSRPLGSPQVDAAEGVAPLPVPRRSRCRLPWAWLYILCFVSAFGVEWFTDGVDRYLRTNRPKFNEGAAVLSVAKTMLEVWRTRWGGFDQPNDAGQSLSPGPLPVDVLGMREDEPHGYELRLERITADTFACSATPTPTNPDPYASTQTVNETGRITGHVDFPAQDNAIIVGWIWFACFLRAWGLFGRAYRRECRGVAPA